VPGHLMVEGSSYLLKYWFKLQFDSRKRLWSGFGTLCVCTLLSISNLSVYK